MPALFISTMRTAVPLVAGWLLTLAVRASVDIDSEPVVAGVTALLTLAYYLAFRGLEILGQRAQGTALQSIAGVLLGWARPPAYPTTASASPTVEGPGPVAI